MHHTYREITTQPEAWAQAWEKVQAHRREALALWEKGGYAHTVFVGCGSTYHLSRAAAAHFQAFTGLPASAWPGGEAVLYPETVYPRHSGPLLLVAVSRSGTTTETLRAVQDFRERKRGSVLVVTNYPDSPLARLGDLTLSIEAGQEQSVVQTRSFASMYVALTAWTLLLAGREGDFQAMKALPQAGARLLSRYEERIRALAQKPWRLVFVLGGGPRYGLAAELALKLQETSLTPAMAYPFLDFRHGPKSLVDGETLVLGLLSETHRNHEEAVLEEARALGASTFTLGETRADVAFHSGLAEALRGVLYLPFVQLLAYYLAVEKGLNPDQPRNLTAVVRLEDL